MKPPAAVIVGPFKYRVSSKRADLATARRDDPSLFSGRTDHASLRILLDPDQCDAKAALQEVLLHEVLHTLTRMTGIAVEIDDKLEERLVNRLAPALLDVLQRNPRLVAFLAA